MNFFARIGSSILLELINMTSFVPGMILFLVLSVAACFYFMRSNFRNILLTDALYDEYEAILEHYKRNEKKQSQATIKFFKANKYLFSGNILSVLAKFFVSLLFAYGITETGIVEKFFDIGLDVTASLNNLKMATNNVPFAMGVILLIFAATMLQYYICLTVSTKSVVESKRVDIALTIATAGMCILMPIGFIPFICLLNAVDCLLMVINTKTLRDKNVQRIQAQAKHFVFSNGDQEWSLRRKKKKK